MRPNIAVQKRKLYECLVCGRTTETPDAGTCPDCAGPLLHLGRSRDL